MYISGLGTLCVKSWVILMTGRPQGENENWNVVCQNAIAGILDDGSALHWSEVTASSLLGIREDNEIVENGSLGWFSVTRFNYNGA